MKSRKVAFLTCMIFIFVNVVSFTQQEKIFHSEEMSISQTQIKQGVSFLMEYVKDSCNEYCDYDNIDYVRIYKNGKIIVHPKQGGLVHKEKEIRNVTR